MGATLAAAGGGRPGRGHSVMFVGLFGSDSEKRHLGVGYQLGSWVFRKRSLELP